MNVNHSKISLAFQATATLTAVFTFFLIVVGALVRVSGSGLGCPDWPLCHGQLLPPLELHPIVEYSHRLTASLVTIFMFGTALWAGLRYRSRKWIFRGSLLAVLLLIVQIALGGITVLAELPPAIVAVHLGNAMLLLATVLAVATIAWTSASNAKRAPRRGISPLFKLILTSAAGVFIIIISGSFVESSGAAGACTTWPLCNPGELVSSGSLPAIHMPRRR